MDPPFADRRQQAEERLMTTMSPDVSWESPAPGAFTRQLRFGEWISEPVTPLFESWLLTAMEERTHADYLKLLGQRVPRPYHVLVNGWYFYTLNWATPGSFARDLPNMLWHLIRSPRTVAGINPSTVATASRSSNGSGEPTSNRGTAPPWSEQKGGSRPSRWPSCRRSSMSWPISPGSCSPRSPPWPAPRTRWRPT